MRDSILVARLDALQQKLDLVPRWVSFGLQGVQMNANLVQGALEMGINQQARNQAARLDTVRQKLEAAGENDSGAVKDAWRRYAEIEMESQVIFRVCLELIGGLAIRDNELDQHIFGVADELVRNCALSSIGAPWFSFTVPAQQEQEEMNKIMGRIIRLRFPEWTIWSLPFTAHEYGHVVVEEHVVLQSFLQAQAEDWNEHHLHEILADTFATYTMGPAYACAAISLRLSPSAAYTDKGNQPADAKRAYAIFSMLRKMNDAANEGPVGRDPYEEMVIKPLEERWETALERIKPPGELGHADTKRLEQLVEAIWDNFSLTVLPTAQYSYDGSGWKLAEEWADDWSKNLAKDQDLSVPDLSETNQRPELRDGLNAAWLCRIFSEQDKVRHITRAAYELCNRIIGKWRYAGQGQGYPQSGLQAAQLGYREASQADR